MSLSLQGLRLMTNPISKDGVCLLFHNYLEKTKKHVFRLEKDIFLGPLSHFITRKNERRLCQCSVSLSLQGLYLLWGGIIHERKFLFSK